MKVYQRPILMKTNFRNNFLTMTVHDRMKVDGIYLVVLKTFQPPA